MATNFLTCDLPVRPCAPAGTYLSCDIIYQTAHCRITVAVYKDCECICRAFICDSKNAKDGGQSSRMEITHILETSIAMDVMPVLDVFSSTSAVASEKDGVNENFWDLMMRDQSLKLRCAGEARVPGASRPSTSPRNGSRPARTATVPGRLGTAKLARGPGTVGAAVARHVRAMSAARAPPPSNHHQPELSTENFHSPLTSGIRACWRYELTRDEHPAVKSKLKYKYLYSRCFPSTPSFIIGTVAADY